MKNGFKRTVALILAAALIFAMAPLAFADDGAALGAQGASDAGAPMLAPEVSGSDGVTALLADTISGALSSEVSSAGDDYRIAGLEVTGNAARVSYEA
ncbi:MAG: hypothetical protein IIZ19_06490, partial [Clostridia bacterium]|nr:hypothetical protein [Clostridia bacterium]